MHVNTFTLRFYIFGTAELIVLKFVSYAETDMICGTSNGQCTCIPAHSTSFLGSWLELGDSRLMIVEFLEVTFSRHDTCKLLCDTSLALARSSPTRRYFRVNTCDDQ